MEMTDEQLSWWAYSRTSMYQLCELCAGAHETSQCAHYWEINPCVKYEEQQHFQWHPQQYQQQYVPSSSGFPDMYEFQHYQQTNPSFQPEVDELEEIRRQCERYAERINSVETLLAQIVKAVERETQQSISEPISENNDDWEQRPEVDELEEIRRQSECTAERIKSMEKLLAQIVEAVEQETQQSIPRTIPETFGDSEQGNASITDEVELQSEASPHMPIEECDHARELDALESALLRTDTEELHENQELVCAYQEDANRGEDADLLLVSKDTDGGSALKPMTEVPFEEPKASVIYTYPPPTYSHEAPEVVLFFKLTDFGLTDKGIGKGRICYTDMPREIKRQKVSRRDDDEVTRREDPANYFYP